MKPATVGGYTDMWIYPTFPLHSFGRCYPRPYIGRNGNEGKYKQWKILKTFQLMFLSFFKTEQ